MAAAISSLAEVLRYENEDVIFRFAEDRDLSLEESKAIFIETKKWLWLCGVHGQERARFPLTLFDELFAVDLMWHTFILFTHDYHGFCQQHFGLFIHHVPRSNRVKPLAPNEQHERLRTTYEFIYDQLGVETLTHWCETMPVTYARLREKP